MGGWCGRGRWGVVGVGVGELGGRYGGGGGGGVG